MIHWFFWWKNSIFFWFSLNFLSLKPSTCMKNNFYELEIILKVFSDHKIINIYHVIDLRPLQIFRKWKLVRHLVLSLDGTVPKNGQKFHKCSVFLDIFQLPGPQYASKTFSMGLKLFWLCSATKTWLGNKFSWSAKGWGHSQSDQCKKIQVF